MITDCIVAYVTNASSKEARVQVQVVEEGRTSEDNECGRHHTSYLRPVLSFSIRGISVRFKFGDFGPVQIYESMEEYLFLFGELIEASKRCLRSFRYYGQMYGRIWWTICLQKRFAAVGMGIALLRMLPNRSFPRTTAYNSFASAISSPIGVGIGIAIDVRSQGPVVDWIYAISMGIACG